MKVGGPKSDGKELRGRIFGVGVIFLLGLFVLAVNLYRLMAVRYDEFLALSVANEFKDVRLRALRGRIIDARGEVLVDSRPSYDVFITPAFCQKCRAEVIPRLAWLLAWSPDNRLKVEEQIRLTHGPQRYLPHVVQVDLSREQFDLLFAHRYLLPGVDVEAVPHRDYRTGPALAHVMGFMNELTPEEFSRFNAGRVDRAPYALGDYIGRRGVERSFEHVLRGRDGWVKQVVNARGEVMRDAQGNVLERDEVPPRPGNDVVLSIDARLQAEAERTFPAVAGAVVAIETKTGFIKALVSRPSFDPNEMTGRVSPQRLAELSRDALQPMVFRAGAQHYSPGSTFKVVTLLAALKAGVITPNTTVTCPGGYRLGSRVWRCHGVHGTVNPTRAVQVSCDTFFYRMADLLNIDPIAEEGRALGLGKITGLGVAGEVPGIMPDEAYHDRVTPGGYQKGMALNTAIGQGDVNVTPLQLAVVYSAIANGGTVYQPQVVKRVQTSDGKVTETFEPQVVQQHEIPPDQRALVMEGLRMVVNEPGGTGRRGRLDDVVVAGKTGTAQVVKIGAVREKKQDMAYFERDHAWFAAVAPFEDPELTIVVLNEHSGHGGTESAPTAKAVFEKYFELKKTDAEAFGPHATPPVAAPAPVIAPPAPAPAPPPVAVAPPVAPAAPDAATQLASTPDAGVKPVATLPHDEDVD